MFGWPEAAIALGGLSVLLALDLRIMKVGLVPKGRGFLAYGFLVATILWLWLGPE